MSLDFVALDFETANSSRASACSIGLVKVQFGQIVAEKSILFKPPVGFDEFNGWNIAIHGITPAMVADRPRFEAVWPEISSFIGDQIVVAHNASFDISVLRASLTASNIAWPTMNYACTMVLSRIIFDLTSHGLSFVAHKSGIAWNEEQHHDALYDADACAQIALVMASQQHVENLPDLLDSLGLSMGILHPDGWETCRVSRSSKSSIEHSRLKGKVSDIPINLDAEITHPLYGKQIVFTGGLHSMSRSDAWFEIAKIGAIPSEAVNRQTNVVVVGQQDISKFKKGETHSEKFRKAEHLKAMGFEIEVISERDFLSFIEPVTGIREGL